MSSSDDVTKKRGEAGGVGRYTRMKKWSGAGPRRLHQPEALVRLVHLVVERAVVYQDGGRYANVATLAEAVGADPSFVRRMLNLTLLAPEMVERVLDGEEPADASTKSLSRDAAVPCK